MSENNLLTAGFEWNGQHIGFDRLKERIREVKGKLDDLWTGNLSDIQQSGIFPRNTPDLSQIEAKWDQVVSRDVLDFGESKSKEPVSENSCVLR